MTDTNDWKRTKTKGFVHGEYTDRYDEWEGPFARYAAGKHAGWSSSVIAKPNFSGSGPGYHGYTNESDEERRKGWPVVEAHVALPVGSEALQARLAGLLRETIGRFLAEENLLVTPEPE